MTISFSQSGCDNEPGVGENCREIVGATTYRHPVFSGYPDQGIEARGGRRGGQD